MTYKVGELLWIQHWDNSGPMIDQPPVLVIGKHFELGMVVYDIFMDGVLELSISEKFLNAIVDPLGRTESLPTKKK
mgnify:CR=1 FL=1